MTKREYDKLKRQWRKQHGRNRRSLHFRRYLQRRQADENAPRCPYGCCTVRGTAHVFREHYPEWLRDELVDCERTAKYERDQSDRAWAGSKVARRYRRLLKRWWALDCQQYTQAIAHWSRLPERYITALGPPAQRSDVPSTYSVTWCRQVAKLYPVQWARIRQDDPFFTTAKGLDTLARARL
jgi:hypothetical protein